jgi:hypothetical protein
MEQQDEYEKYEQKKRKAREERQAARKANPAANPKGERWKATWYSIPYIPSKDGFTPRFD